MTETESFTTRKLEEKPFTSQISARGSNQENWDVETLVEQILAELDGKADRSEVFQIVQKCCLTMKMSGLKPLCLFSSEKKH